MGGALNEATKSEVASAPAAEIGQTVDQERSGVKDSTDDIYIPRDAKGKIAPLPRNKHGVDIPSSDVPHTQLGEKISGKTGKEYRQTRQWDSNGQEVKTTDWTDHGNSRIHTNPHDHPAIPNSTGGTLKRGDAEPFKVIVPKN